MCPSIATFRYVCEIPGQLTRLAPHTSAQPWRHRVQLQKEVCIAVGGHRVFRRILPAAMDGKPPAMDQNQYFDTAIRAVHEKKPVPEIDFTLHTMEDGTQVSTQERVCKGKLVFL